MATEPRADGPPGYNLRVSATSAPAPPRVCGLAPAQAGVLCCLAAAVLYTGVNICLRAVAGQGYQPWVICIKESVTVWLLGPWLLGQLLRGRLVRPPLRPLAALIAVALAIQLVANLCFLRSLELVGLSITIPAVNAVNLTGTALLGWFLLREGVGWRTGFGIALVIGAVAVLHWGAGMGNASAAGWGPGVLAVGAACLAGGVYALFSVTVRKIVTGTIPPTIVVFLVTAVGVLSLGPLSLWRLGWDGLRATPPGLLGLMLLAGVLNFLGFLAITKGFQLTSAVRANLLNASQVALGAVAGLLLFAEPPRLAVLLGIALTVAGNSLVGPTTARGKP